MKASPFTRHAAVTALGYALLAGAWIFYSDSLMGVIADPELAARIGTAKGLAFVLVTALALFGLLRAGAPESPRLARDALRRGRWLALVFLVLGGVVVLLGAASYRAHHAETLMREKVRLATLARLKAREIEHWLAERAADARSQAVSPLLADTLMRWKDGGGARESRLINERLATLLTVHDYLGAEILDPEGRRMFGAGLPLPAGPALAAALHAAADSPRPVRLDMDDTGSGGLRLAYLTAVRAPSGGALLGVLALSGNGHQDLENTLGNWVGTLASEELLVVHPVGGEVHFIAADGRHRPAPQPAAAAGAGGRLLKAVLEQAGGTHEGRDERDVEVLAASEAVADTPWRLLVRVDREEVLRDTRHQGLVNALASLGAILTAGLVAGLAWRQQALSDALAEAEQRRLLDASRERFQATFEQAAVGIAHLSPDGRWLRVNQRLCELLGRDEAELKVTSFQAITHPEDLARDLALVRQLLDGEIANYSMEKRYFRPDGAMLWANLTVSLVRRADGGPDYFVSVIEDIGPRKQAEQQLRRMNALYATLSETNQAIVRASDAAAVHQQICDIAVRFGGFALAWTGLAEGEEFVVAAVAGPAAGYIDGIRVSPRGDRAEGQGPTGRVFRTGEHYVCNDFSADPATLPWRERAARYGLQASAAFPLREGGRVVGVFSIYASERDFFQPPELRLLDEMALDISFALDNLRQQEQLRLALDELTRTRDALETRVFERTAELSAAKDRAEESDRVKSAFLATMSHELRTPLNSIIGFTGVLLQRLPGPLSAEQEKQLNIVRNAARHLLALINDVLDISRIEAGEMRMNLADFDLTALLDRVAAAFRPQLEHAGLEFRLRLPAGACPVHADPRRVEQVVNNLLSNALKFTERGSVSLELQAAEGERRIAVADTGIGIAPEALPRLFRPFAQVDSGLARSREGTGLGLAISRRLAEAMGGRLYVDTLPGRGSTFWFSIPDTK